MKPFGLQLPTWHGERRRRSPRYYAFDSRLHVTAIASAGSSDSVNPPNWFLSTGIAAAFPCRWNVEQLFANQLFDVPGTGLNAFDRPWYFSVFMREHTVGSPLNVDTGGGIAIGPATAWPIPANDANAYILLRTRHTAVDDEWILQVNPAGGPTTTTVLVGVPIGATGGNYFLELAFKPAEYVRAYVNGTLGAEQAVNLPTGNTFAGQGAGFVVGVGGAVPTTAEACRYWEGYVENVGKAAAP